MGRDADSDSGSGGAGREGETAGNGSVGDDSGECEWGNSVRGESGFAHAECGTMIELVSNRCRVVARLDGVLEQPS